MKMRDLVQPKTAMVGEIKKMHFPSTAARKLFSAALLAIALFAKSYKEAQSYLVQLAKELAARGEIIIAESEEDQLVY